MCMCMCMCVCGKVGTLYGTYLTKTQNKQNKQNTQDIRDLRDTRDTRDTQDDFFYLRLLVFHLASSVLSFPRCVNLAPHMKIVVCIPQTIPDKISSPGTKNLFFSTSLQLLSPSSPYLVRSFFQDHRKAPPSCYRVCYSDLTSSVFSPPTCKD